jgi:hypothetical protein
MRKALFSIGAIRFITNRFFRAFTNGQLREPPIFSQPYGHGFVALPFWMYVYLKIRSAVRWFLRDSCQLE